MQHVVGWAWKVLLAIVGHYQTHSLERIDTTGSRSSCSARRRRPAAVSQTIRLHVWAYAVPRILGPEMLIR
uniref:Secreted protein n=1 Tax=Setaria digitata TaxID=48799 RepID=A0A915PJN0_9BILA